MAQVKYQTAYVSSVAVGTYANPTVGGVDLPTIGDDNKDRLVTGVFMGISTAGVAFDLNEAGGKKTNIDGTLFSAAYGPVPVRQLFPTGQIIHVDLYNSTAGVLTNVPVVIRYEIPDGV